MIIEWLFVYYPLIISDFYIDYSFHNDEYAYVFVANQPEVNERLFMKTMHLPLLISNITTMYCVKS